MERGLTLYQAPVPMAVQTAEFGSLFVSLDRTVNIYLNNDLVTSPTAKFNTKGRGGVLVVNGYQNIVLFRGFDINKQ